MIRSHVLAMDGADNKFATMVAKPKFIRVVECLAECHSVVISCLHPGAISCLDGTQPGVSLSTIELCAIPFKLSKFFGMPNAVKVRTIVHNSVPGTSSNPGVKEALGMVGNNRSLRILGLFAKEMPVSRCTSVMTFLQIEFSTARHSDVVTCCGVEAQPVAPAGHVLDDPLLVGAVGITPRTDEKDLLGSILHVLGHKRMLGSSEEKTMDASNAHFTIEWGVHPEHVSVLD